MALTVTASPPTRECVLKSLCMLHPVIVYVTPQKKNIMYSVEKKVLRVLSKKLLPTLFILVNTCLE